MPLFLSPKILSVLTAEIAGTAVALVECRRVSVRVLTRLCEAFDKAGPAVSETNGNGGASELMAMLLPAALQGLLAGLHDYTIDSHGDIGSGVREAAMRGLSFLLLRGAREPAGLVDADVARAVGGLVQQALEKIDRTRAVAGASLLDVVYADPPVPHVPAHHELRAIFGWEMADRKKKKRVMATRDRLFIFFFLI